VQRKSKRIGSVLDYRLCKDKYLLEEEQKDTGEICYSEKLHWGTFDLYGYCTKISLVVLPPDVLNLCVLQGIVLLRKYAHKSYTYIPRPHPRGNWKQTYLLYYMLDILITFCVIIYKLCNSSRRHQILSPYRIYHNDRILSNTSHRISCMTCQHCKTVSLSEQRNMLNFSRKRWQNVTWESV
jgi:hypothetical protein